MLANIQIIFTKILTPFKLLKIGCTNIWYRVQDFFHSYISYFAPDMNSKFKSITSLQHFMTIANCYYLHYVVIMAKNVFSL